MRIALAQVDCRGDIEKNLALARSTVAEATAAGADLVVFPELSLHGNPLAQAAERAVSSSDSRIAELSSGAVDVVAGFYEDGGVRTYNSAGYFSGGRTHFVHRKLYLPNYAVWEERKGSSPGQGMRAFDTRFGRIATLICNDAWQPALPWLAAQDGAEVLLVPTNSAAVLGSDSHDIIEYWCRLMAFIARMQQCWVVFVNRVGDEHGATFWGGSRVIDPDGRTVAEAPLWEPNLLVREIEVPVARRRRQEVPLIAEARLGLIEHEVQRLIREAGDALSGVAPRFPIELSRTHATNINV
ncbi:nitrilase-related carbon-nitrogen hydrolase [Rhodococcus spongiicola]|uniref:Amidohydrolase n=1 Tax=Rhodococcus spongiicola TaxID=2487352 RepID=A0A3S3BQE9_9NOCA|nr:nitrilase-related carbon-nitrogen hydrolase [Rhodococcus spongiicola]RVW06785.1 amidohydrolase [Rhodococcus spongiicola]